MNFFRKLFAKKSKYYKDENLGILTYDPKSPRIDIQKSLTGLKIEIDWLSGKININYLERDRKVEVVHPSICDEPAEIPASLDTGKFLSRKSFPSPYKGREINERIGGSTTRLKAYWTELCLLHPSETVVLETLRNQKKYSDIGVLHDLTGLMVCSSENVRIEIAKTMWEQTESALDYFFNVLGNQGIMLSGVLHEEGKNAALLMREYCPAGRKDYFREKALEPFGPSVAGVKVKKKKGNVKFKTRYTKPLPFGQTGNYEIYTAPSKEDARVFLESYSIMKYFFYVEVETPEGPLGKDIAGIY